jgi:flagellar FliJ protein
MAAFHFSLEQALAYRAMLEEQARLRFAALQAEYLATRRRLEKLEEQLAAQQAALYGGTLDDMGRWLCERYIKAVRGDIDQAARALQQLTIMLEEARMVLVLKAKDKKILEKFKEKQAIRYAREEKIQEQRLYDETASTRFKAPDF